MSQVTKNAAPHQQRVIDEATNLSENVNKLHHFIYSNDLFNKQTEIEQYLMHKQLKEMMQYHSTLSNRISLFI